MSPRTAAPQLAAPRAPLAPLELGRPAAAHGIVGRSRAIEFVLEAIERVAATPRTTVLISGESGVGKELVARAIHARSRRAREPFVAVNCAALTESLLEAELFGYEPGAFTGALPKGKDGLLAAAEGGSLLFDEIGELAPLLQAKLLRVLQERTYRRVGGHVDVPLDVRILASTNRDLQAMVAAGAFREDLFYRLNVMSIAVPPLRERHGDVALLAQHFLERCAGELGREFAPLAPELVARLEAHRWPGNVRELGNAIERAALLARDSTLEAQAFDFVGAGAIPRATPRVTADSEKPSSYGLAQVEPALGSGEHALDSSDPTLASVERAHVLRVIARVHGNRSQAARVLGINRATLYNKLRAWGQPL